MLLTWAPSRGAAALQLAVGVVLLGLVVVVAPLGRVLLVPAGLAIAAFALRDLLLVPTVQADADGLVVAAGLTRRAVDWSQLAGLRVIRDRRTPLLELDLGDTLVVLSRRRLGVAPYLVLDALEQLRP